VFQNAKLYNSEADPVYKVRASGFGVEGVGWRVKGLVFGGSGVECGVLGVGCEVLGSGCRVVFQNTKQYNSEADPVYKVCRFSSYISILGDI